MALLANVFAIARTVKEAHAAVGSLIIDQSVYGSLTSGQFTDSANSAYFLDPANTGNSLITAGNVGIGTTGPSERVEISAGAPSSATFADKKLSFYTRRAGGGLAGDLLGQIIFKSTRADQDSGYPGAAIGAVLESNVANYNVPTSLRFYTSNSDIGDGLASGSQGERMRITPAGNVGIGTTSPQGKLDVVGAAYSTSGTWSGSDIRWKGSVHLSG